LQYRADGQKAEWIYTYSHPGFRRVMNSHEKVAKIYLHEKQSWHQIILFVADKRLISAAGLLIMLNNDVCTVNINRLVSSVSNSVSSD